MIPANTQTHHCGLHYSMILASSCSYFQHLSINYYFDSGALHLSPEECSFFNGCFYGSTSSHIYKHTITARICQKIVYALHPLATLPLCLDKSTKCYLRKNSVSKYLLPKQPFHLSFRNRKQIIALKGSSGLWTASKPCCPACSNTLVMPAYTINDVANRDTKG